MGMQIWDYLISTFMTPWNVDAQQTWVMAREMR